MFVNGVTAITNDHLSFAIFFSNGMFFGCKISTDKHSRISSAIADILVIAIGNLVLADD